MASLFLSFLLFAIICYYSLLFFPIVYYCFAFVDEENNNGGSSFIRLDKRDTDGCLDRCEGICTRIRVMVYLVFLQNVFAQIVNVFVKLKHVFVQITNYICLMVAWPDVKEYAPG